MFAFDIGKHALSSRIHTCIDGKRTIGLGLLRLQLHVHVVSFKDQSISVKPILTDTFWWVSHIKNSIFMVSHHPSDQSFSVDRCRPVWPLSLLHLPSVIALFPRIHSTYIISVKQALFQKGITFLRRKIFVIPRRKAIQLLPCLRYNSFSSS